MTDRSSEADEPELVTDEDERARIEATNSLRQFDAAMLELKKWLSSPGRRLKPSDILHLHRVLMERLSEYAGVYRPARVKIKGSYHAPPQSHEVPGYVEELCEYLAINWDKKTSIHLAAYTLWRVNWIHPFSDGNGRTARIVSYLVLCAHSQKELPGDLTIPEQISRNKKPYYAALEAADDRLKRGTVDVRTLEDLLNACLANQLFDFYRVASGEDDSTINVPASELVQVLDQARREGAEDRTAVYARPNATFSLAWIERHPALFTFLGSIIAALLAWLLSKYF